MDNLGRDMQRAMYIVLAGAVTLGLLIGLAISSVARKLWGTP